MYIRYTYDFSSLLLSGKNNSIKHVFIKEVDFEAGGLKGELFVRV